MPARQDVLSPRPSRLALPSMKISIVMVWTLIDISQTAIATVLPCELLGTFSQSQLAAYILQPSIGVTYGEQQLSGKERHINLRKSPGRQPVCLEHPAGQTEIYQPGAPGISCCLLWGRLDL